MQCNEMQFNLALFNLTMLNTCSLKQKYRIAIMKTFKPKVRLCRSSNRPRMGLFLVSSTLSTMASHSPDHRAPPWDVSTTKSKPCDGDCRPVGRENDTPTQTDPLVIPSFIIGSTPHCTATEEHLRWVYRSSFDLRSHYILQTNPFRGLAQEWFISMSCPSLKHGEQDRFTYRGLYIGIYTPCEE